MKSIIFLVLVCCVGSIPVVVAGPGSAGGGAQIAPVNDAVVTPAAPVKAFTDVGAGFNARDNAGNQSNAANASPSSPGTASNSSSTGRNAFSNGFQHQNTSNASNFTDYGREKMVEVPDGHFLTAATEKSDKTETAKKFETSILNTGIDQAGNSKARANNSYFAPVNPVTGEIISARSPVAGGLVSPQSGSAHPVAGTALFAPVNPVIGESVSRINPVAGGIVLPQTGSTNPFAATALFAPVNPATGEEIRAISPTAPGTVSSQAPAALGTSLMPSATTQPR